MNQKQRIPYSKIGVLSFAHMLNDLYSNYLPQLLPFLVALTPSFTATRAAILVSAFTITSSLVQHFSAIFWIAKANVGSSMWELYGWGSCSA